MVNLSCLTEGVYSSEELDYRSTDLIGILGVRLLRTTCIPRVYLYRAESAVFETGDHSLPLAPGMEHVSWYPLDQDLSFDLGHLILDGFLVAETRVERHDLLESVRPLS